MTTKPNVFGKDTYDQYSVPESNKLTKLASLFKLLPRKRPDKPGRVLEIIWDIRKPLVKGFKNNYSYIVKFDKKGSIAGNHYHKNKHEIFFPINGNFNVVLKDVFTEETEELTINSNDFVALFVKTNIAHAVKCNSNNGILLVTASSQEAEKDEFPYELLKKLD